MRAFGATPPEPYTHAVHARRCREAADEGEVLAGQFLQVKSGPVVYCARIVAAWDHQDAGEMWKLELLFPVKGLQSFPAKRSRQCGGVDGRCVCELDAHEARGTRADRAAGSQGVTC
ncbi:hypothetical protein QFZ83_003062 [Variovorax sp. W1I1]|uniref:hypothetical protein n=1 Tax=Variovorax sp. W1I1 TaxID=3042309 RepID=UPI0027869715|nr:hypothetical protein [Variovorax sp. W1I1]MDQ0608891.1 hypothetical protein [Variovorax sp. W1I1]